MSAPSLARVRLIAGLCSLMVNAAALGALFHFARANRLYFSEPQTVFSLVDLEPAPMPAPAPAHAAPRSSATFAAAPRAAFSQAPLPESVVTEIAAISSIPPPSLTPSPSAAEEDAYARAVWTQLAAHRPRAAGTRRTARIGFALDRDGALRYARLLQSSGDQAFDAACLDAVRAAAPFPPAPSGASDAALIFVAPISTRAR